MTEPVKLKVITFFGEKNNEYNVMITNGSDSRQMANNIWKKLKGIVAVPCGEAFFQFTNKELLEEHIQRISEECSKI